MTAAPRRSAVHPACTARRAPCTERVADAHGRGRRQAQRHHERQADDVERDLIEAEATGSSRPASIVAAAKTPTSRVICDAAGKPSAMRRFIRAASIANGMRGCSGSCRCTRYTVTRRNSAM